MHNVWNLKTWISSATESTPKESAGLCGAASKSTHALWRHCIRNRPAAADSERAALSKVRGGGGSNLGSTQVRTPGPPGGGRGGGGWEQQHREPGFNFFSELSEQMRSTVLVFGL